MLFYPLLRSRHKKCYVIWGPYYQTYLNMLRKFVKYVYFKFLVGKYTVRHCDQCELPINVTEFVIFIQSILYCISSKTVVW